LKNFLYFFKTHYTEFHGLMRHYNNFPPIPESRLVSMMETQMVWN